MATPSIVDLVQQFITQLGGSSPRRSAGLTPAMQERAPTGGGQGIAVDGFARRTGMSAGVPEMQMGSAKQPTVSNTADLIKRRNAWMRERSMGETDELFGDWHQRVYGEPVPSTGAE